MFYKIYLFLFLIILKSVLFSQIDPGTRQIALANSDIANSNDVFAIFNNSAGLSQYNWREIGIHHSPSPFSIPELSNTYVAYSEPFNFGTIAVGFMIFGFELYKESKIAFSFSKSITNNFFLGITLVYNTISIQNYGDANTLILNFGGLSYITSKWRIGFVVKNLTRSTFGGKDQIPTTLDFGISYDFDNMFTLNFAIEKEWEYPVSLRCGIEYLIIKYLYLRLGFNNEPNRFSTGIGINYSYFQLDYSVFTHQELGLTHQIGLRIHFKEFDSRREAINKYLRYL